MDAFLWSCLLCFLIGGGTSASDPERPPVQVSAVLDEEVTFPVRIRDAFEIDEISWDFKGATIARMTPGNNYIVRDKRFEGRLYATDDKGSLNIRNLRTEDAGFYTIYIFKKTKPTERETKRYDLKLFRRVKAQIIPITTPESANRRCLISFNCTVNDNTYVSYIWRGEKVGPSVEPVLSLSLTESESNLIICCTVKNPVSEASDCVLPREHCFPGATAFTCAACTCGYPERIIACAAATILCALVGFIVYRCEQRKEQDQFDK